MIQQSNNPVLHFIGIGGCGMNGVAQLAAHAGYNVSGSDRATGLEIFQCLEKQGISIVPQDGSGITEQTDFVVYSTAIESDNPDIQKARSLDTPLLHRAEMLAKLCEGKKVIAVAGTAGKSTVTGLLGWIFQCLEKDPTVYCGAPVLNWKTSDKLAGQASLYPESLRPAKENTRSRIPDSCPAATSGNVRFGSEDGPWIIEADESDKSFLNFHPDHAIITNIAEDHFSLAELHKLFAQFEAQVSGVVIKQPSTLPPFHSPLPGKHNIENAANALTLCKALGLDMPKCIEAVTTFKGIERRLERVGSKVIDDFAHSPIKIAAALEAVSDVWPAYNAVWRPHGFTPLFQGLEAFIESFSKHRNQGGVRPPGAPGKLYILPVYYAGGTVNRKITSKQFVERLQAAGVPAEFVEDFQTLETRLVEENRPVLLMGARDPELPKFARRIASRLA
jgi:UDP-N-acetylmuramate--alanine ligase